MYVYMSIVLPPLSLSPPPQHTPGQTQIDYHGFVRVHMCVQRPIHVSTAITRTSWYRLMRPVKDRSSLETDDHGFEVRARGGVASAVQLTAKGVACELVGESVCVI